MFTQSFKHYKINCNIVYFFVIIHEICPISGPKENYFIYYYKKIYEKRKCKKKKEKGV